MKRQDIILASASPRRIRMFRERGYEAESVPSRVRESVPFEMDPETAVMYLALIKARDVMQKRKGLIISADTVVVYQGRIITKPESPEEAFRILSGMREDRHQVITGVCIADNSGERPRVRCLYDTTDVFFGYYSDEWLREYVQPREPYDKAGGYAIQETFGQHVDHIEGDMDNVIGFPMYQVEKYLQEPPEEERR